jgi:hypothetical protein
MKLPSFGKKKKAPSAAEGADPEANPGGDTEPKSKTLEMPDPEAAAAKAAAKKKGKTDEEQVRPSGWVGERDCVGGLLV